MLVEHREGDVGQQRREDAALRGAGDRVPVGAILGEDAGLQERLHQAQDASVSDPMPHPIQQGRVRDFVEACLDVTFQHPLIGAGGEKWISAMASWARRFGRKP